MLTYDANQRITAEDALQHPWIKKKVHENHDPTATLSALKNLKNFRVSLQRLTTIFINIFII